MPFILLFAVLSLDAEAPEWKPVPDETPDFAAEAEPPAPEWKPLPAETKEPVSEAPDFAVKEKPPAPEWKPLPAETEEPVSEAPDSAVEEEPPAAECKPAPDAPISEDPEKKPFGWERKYFEIGFDAGFGFANDLLGAGDIFQETLVINLNKFKDTITENGWNLNLEPDFDFFFNVMPGSYWGGGFALVIDGGINGNIPKSLFTLLAEGNTNNHNIDGDASVSGAIFAGMEIEVHGRLKSFDKLKFGITPGVFYPLVYIPKSTITYRLHTDPNLSVSTSGNIEVYTPFSLETMEDPAGSVLRSGGFDFSLAGEYALFEAQSWGSLAVGSTIAHIPLVPAALKNRMTVSMNNDNIITDKEGNAAKNLFDGIGDIDFRSETTYDTVEKKVIRPIRVDFYAVYQPFATDWLTVTPNLGFTVLTPGDPSFNWGINSQVNFKHMFGFHLGTGWNEWIWKHQAGIVLNFRAFELDIDASLRSQSFVQSFQARGFSVKVGIRFGW